MKAGAPKDVAATAARAVPLSDGAPRTGPLPAATAITAAAAALGKGASERSARRVGTVAAAAAHALASAAAARGWDGAGSPGTRMAHGTRGYRVIAVLAQVRMILGRHTQMGFWGPLYGLCLAFRVWV